MVNKDSLVKCVFNKSDLLNGMISAASNVVSESELEFTSKGIYMIGRNSSNTMLVELMIPADSLTVYDLKKDLKIGVNINNLKSILSRSSDKDVLTIQSDGSKVLLVMKSDKLKTFELPVIDVERDDIKFPQLEFKSSVNLYYKLVQDAIDDISIFSDEFSVELSPKQLIFSGRSTLEEVRNEIDGDDEVKIICKTAERLKAKYNINFIRGAILAWKHNDHPVLHLSDSYPLMLDFSNDRAKLRFVIAPRVE